jgi:hypothetical protein
MATRPLSDHVRAYEWRCDGCSAINVESDARCWFCDWGMDGEEPDDDAPRSAARRDTDIVDAIVETLTFDTRHISRPAALHAVTRRLAEQYGRQLTDRALAQYRRELERQKRALERQLAEQEERRKKGLQP